MASTNNRHSWRPPSSATHAPQIVFPTDVPTITGTDSFIDVVRTLCSCIEDAINIPYTFEQLKSGDGAQDLMPLVHCLTTEWEHTFLVSALLVLRYHFKDPDDHGVSQARAYACELLAWRLTLKYSREERLEALLSELVIEERPRPVEHNDGEADDGQQHGMTYGSDDGDFDDAERANERTAMLQKVRKARRFGDEVSFLKQFAKNNMRKLTGRKTDISESSSTIYPPSSSTSSDPTLPFLGLNALEIAAVAEAKKFLSQRTVQLSINAIWNGDIMFWNSVSPQAERRAHYYEKEAHVDPYCRLRVPKYQKTMETVFLLALLALYFVVMREEGGMQVQVGIEGVSTTSNLSNNLKTPSSRTLTTGEGHGHGYGGHLHNHAQTHLTVAEILLYIWIAAFTYEELGSFSDAGMRLYTTDLWNIMDVGIVGVALAYVITRAIGLAQQSRHVNEGDGDGDGANKHATTELAFDILSLMAVPLVPRTFSLLSLHPYFGTLIPSLSQITKDLMKFLVIVLVVYFGFASTFVLLGRDAYSAREMFWLLIYIFNGAGVKGLDLSDSISKLFGPTIMVLFVCITNILLLPTLISLLTNSLTAVMGNAREEFLFQYSVLVLESCASKRLTYFLPPLNLIPLIFLRPLRLVLPASQVAARSRSLADKGRWLDGSGDATKTAQQNAVRGSLQDRGVQAKRALS